MSRALDRLLCRIASGLFSRVRPHTLPMTPEDLRVMRVSFSQFGEDLVVAEHLRGVGRTVKGIYIDAGCFDPFRFSNTRLLNLLGWRGINVDASKDSIRKFEEHRPADYNVCAALGAVEQNDEFVETAYGAGSRLSSSPAPVPERVRIKARIAVKTRTLASVMADSPFSDDHVDFLDIDCEGSDLAVLKGYPLGDKRPALICIESHSSEESQEATSYLTAQDYSEVCRLGPSLIFRDRRLVG